MMGAHQNLTVYGHFVGNESNEHKNITIIYMNLADYVKGICDSAINWKSIK